MDAESGDQCADLHRHVREESEVDLAWGRQSPGGVTRLLALLT